MNITEEMYYILIHLADRIGLYANKSIIYGIITHNNVILALRRLSGKFSGINHLYSFVIDHK